MKTLGAVVASQSSNNGQDYHCGLSIKDLFYVLIDNKLSHCGKAILSSTQKRQKWRSG